MRERAQLRLVPTPDHPPPRRLESSAAIAEWVAERRATLTALQTRERARSEARVA
jgi:hypothetical protein